MRSRCWYLRRRSRGFARRAPAVAAALGQSSQLHAVVDRPSSAAASRATSSHQQSPHTQPRKLQFHGVPGTCETRVGGRALSPADDVSEGPPHGRLGRPDPAARVFALHYGGLCVRASAARRCGPQPQPRTRGPQIWCSCRTAPSGVLPRCQPCGSGRSLSLRPRPHTPGPPVSEHPGWRATGTPPQRHTPAESSPHHNGPCFLLVLPGDPCPPMLHPLPRCHVLPGPFAMPTLSGRKLSGFIPRQCRARWQLAAAGPGIRLPGCSGSACRASGNGGGSGVSPYGVCHSR